MTSANARQEARRVGTNGRFSAPARRAALAGYLGGMLEYYDVNIYAPAAALVFGHIFFPGTGIAGTLASFATFGVSYVSRPVGAILIGHIGDRMGRKAALVLALVSMGACSFLMGLLPTYAQIGIWAPILLVALRLLSGVSAGGETATASSLTVEVAPPGRRGFYTSWVPNGIVSGTVLANLAFLLVSMLPKDDMLSWGWRIPFLASAIVTAVGLIIRVKLTEPEAFEEAKRADELIKTPIFDALTTQLGSVIRVALCTLGFAMNTILSVFGLSYATGISELTSTDMLTITVGANLVALLTQPLLAILSDRIGRKFMYITGCLGSAVLIFPYFVAISTGNTWLIFAVSTAIVAGTYGAIEAIHPAFFAEMFSLRARATGMAVGLQIGLLSSGFAPAIATALVGDDKTNWMPVAVLAATINVIAAVAASAGRETYKTPLEQLGPKTAQGTS